MVGCPAVANGLKLCLTLSCLTVRVERKIATFGTLISGNHTHMMLLIHYFFVYIAKFEQLTDFTHYKIQ